MPVRPIPTNPSNRGRQTAWLAVILGGLLVGRQGPQLATLQKLPRYWATEYDSRKVEVKLNALPNFVTMIDGPDIHFIHVRSVRNKNGMPLSATHG